jgi:hypothetical protein
VRVTRFILLAVGVLVAPLARSADIYRWVDEQGRTHISDTVPERYRGVATRLDAKPIEPTAQQRAEAADRAAKDRAALADLDAARRAHAQAAAASAASAPSGSKRVAPVGSECDRLWQEYHESQECFAPYQLGPWGIKAEAFKKCKEVRNPSQQCGPSKSMGQQ